MGRIFEPLWMVLGMAVLLVTQAHAAPGEAEPRACVALLRQFNVFDERHPAEAGADKASSAEAGLSYKAELERIRHAARQGNIRAEGALGAMYLEGACGLEKNMDKALAFGARAGGYFGIAMMFMDRRKPMQAYEWFTIGLLKDPWYTDRDVRLTLKQAGTAHPTDAQVQVYLDRVAVAKDVIRKRLKLLQTMANMSDDQVSRARRQARAWLRAHP